MQMHKPNVFTEYYLTPDEEKTGSILTTLQTQVLQNRLAEYAKMKIALVVDTTNFNAYLQTEAELNGQIMLLQELLSQSQEAQTEVIR